MKEKSLLVQLRPHVFTWWRSLPVLGLVVDDFLQWLGNKGYARGTIRNYLHTLPQIVRWFRRHQITRFDQLTQQQLQVLREHYRAQKDDASSGGSRRAGAKGCCRGGVLHWVGRCNGTTQTVGLILAERQRRGADMIEYFDPIRRSRRAGPD